jgi:DNA polymerase-3 subunit epsilon
MTGFLAVDFETAAPQRDSACALGYAHFESGRAVETGARLINPNLEPSRWSPFNMAIHGITPEDVESAPSFEAVWGDLLARFDGLPMVAHNAGFDMSVIRACLTAEGIRPARELRYTCSASLCRRVWPNLVSVSLPVVAEWLEIPLDHHEPGSDAEACGAIVLRVIEELEVEGIEQALERVEHNWGVIRPDMTWKTGHPEWSLRAKDFQPDPDGLFDTEHPLYGRSVVITGSLDSMSRREAYRALKDLGATPSDRVTKTTDFLVTGEQDLTRLARGETLSGKQRRAADLRAAGCEIEVVSEDDFRRMLFQ